MEKASKKQLKLIRELLRDRKAREDSDLFVAEGNKIVRDIFVNKVKISEVFVTNASADKNKELIADLREKKIPVFSVKNADIEKISSLKNSQGILAVAHKPGKSFNLVEDGKQVIVLCDGVQDPGNLGAIIRSALAFGAEAVIYTKDTVDPYNPKVVRASSGGVSGIALYKYSEELMNNLKKRQYIVLASSVNGSGAFNVCEAKDLDSPAIIIFGNEGSGISPEILEKTDKFFHIPVSDKVESLNVAAACAVTLYELSRGK